MAPFLRSVVSHLSMACLTALGSRVFFFLLLFFDGMFDGSGIAGVFSFFSYFFPLIACLTALGSRESVMLIVTHLGKLYTVFVPPL